VPGSIGPIRAWSAAGPLRSGCRSGSGSTPSEIVFLKLIANGRRTTARLHCGQWHASTMRNAQQRVLLRDPLSCAGHRQLASARQGLRFCPSTNGTGGRFLGKSARGRKSGPTRPARAHRASPAQAEPGGRDRNTAPLLHQSRNAVTPNSASADFSAVARQSPHRVEFRCAGSIINRKWSGPRCRATSCNRCIRR
jgi:hypothetical protein